MEQVATERAMQIRLPREVFLLCAVAPWFTLPLLEGGLFALPWQEALRGAAANYVPFLGIPTMLQLSYRALPVRWYAHASRWRRFGVHGVIMTSVALVAALLLRAPHDWVRGVECAWPHWTIACVVMTWFFMLPTAIVQELRDHAALAEQRARLAREAALRAQLEALQARTNPHFLFNGFNTVASLIADDPARAEENLLRLAEIMRYALEGSRAREVPLARELEIVRDYLELQAARFGERLRFRIEVDPRARSIAVPPLSVQPLVENAVLHGLGTRRAGGEVEVHVSCGARAAFIDVLDDGVGPEASEHRGTGTALRDLEQRLHILYGEAGKLERGQRAQGGYRVRVTLPLSEAAE
jgi:hypothetical protein